MTQDQPTPPAPDEGAEPSRPSVFISYRREDSAAHAGRLYDALAQRFGRSQVFTDVYDIGAGEEFEQVIRERLSQTTVFVAVIGPRWRGPRGWHRRPRISQPGDFVRRELEMAREARVRILPVLVADARLPKASSLPDSIRFLNGLNASELRDTRWEDDVAALARAVEAAHKKGPTRPPTPVPPPTPTPWPSWLRQLARWLVGLAVGLSVLAGLIWGARACSNGGPTPQNNNHPSPAPTTPATPTPSPTGGPTPTPSPGPVVHHTVAEVAESPASRDTIDVAFLNIEWFTNQVDGARVQNVAGALVALDADAVGVTEVQNEAVSRLTAALTNKGYPAGYVYQDAQGEQDLALIYRRDRLHCEREEKVYTEQQSRLEAQDDETHSPVFPRVPLFARCTSARLTTPLRIVVVHFKAMGDDTSKRRRQLASVNLGEIIRDSGRTIVGGDFNARPAEALDMFMGLADVGGLYPLFQAGADAVSYIGSPQFRELIDHIWASPDLKLAPVGQASSVVVTLDQSIQQYNELVSDHRPVMVRLAHER